MIQIAYVEKEGEADNQTMSYYTDADIEMAELTEAGNALAAGLCIVCGARLDDELEGFVSILDDRHDDCIDEELLYWLTEEIR